jgi:hypothetical protein
MPEVVDLLDPVAQQTLRSKLQEDPDLGEYAGLLDDETLAALAFVGAYPKDLQDLVAGIVPTGPRSQLDAYRLVDREDTGERIAWRMTERGRQLAVVLASAVEPPSEVQRQTAERQLRKLIEEGNAEVESGS